MDHPEPGGPDLTVGVSRDKLADGAALLGHVGCEEVLLARIGSEFFAVGARCTHCHGPLVAGLVVGGTNSMFVASCCFDLRTGEACRAPAFDPLSCWAVELPDDRVFVHSRSSQPKAPKKGKSVSGTSERIVIVGGGAADFAADETLRRAKFAGSIVMLSNDASAPVDFPSLSKDYLAGNAPEDRVPLERIGCRWGRGTCSGRASDSRSRRPS